MTVSRAGSEVNDSEERALRTLVRNGAAMCLAAASGATDAIGYPGLGHVFTSAMTGNLALLGIALAHLDGVRIGRVLVSLICYMVGAAVGARIARTPEPGDPVWPQAITRALAIEALFFAAYAAVWWTVGAGPDVDTKGLLLGLGAIALGIQSSAMQRFGNGLGLNTTFVSGALIKLVGLVCGCVLGALLVLRAPEFAPAVPLLALALTLCAAGWQARARHRAPMEVSR